MTTLVAVATTAEMLDYLAEARVLGLPQTRQSATLPGGEVAFCRPLDQQDVIDRDEPGNFDAIIYPRSSLPQNERRALERKYLAA